MIGMLNDECDTGILVVMVGMMVWLVMMGLRVQWIRGKSGYG